MPIFRTANARAPPDPSDSIGHARTGLESLSAIKRERQRFWPIKANRALHALHSLKGKSLSLNARVTID